MRSAEEIIRNYISDNTGSIDIRDEEDMFESGLVNSLFAIQLMTFLERTFDIKVTMDDLELDNFKSVAAASLFVRGKLRTTGND